MIFEFVNRITPKQTSFLMIIGVPAMLLGIMNFNEILVGSLLCLFIFSFMGVVFWNDATERQKLKKENQELKDKLNITKE